MALGNSSGGVKSAESELEYKEYMSKKSSSFNVDSTNPFLNLLSTPSARMPLPLGRG